MSSGHIGLSGKLDAGQYWPQREILIMIAFFSLGMFVVLTIFGVACLTFLQERSATAIFRLVLQLSLLVLGLKQLVDPRRMQN
jgi:purine-cytosine permease-like protein